MDAMRKTYPPSDFALVAVDVSNRPKMTQDYLNSINSDYAMLMDAEKAVRKTYKVPGTPVTIIIDRKGRAIFRHLGYSPGDEKTFQEEVELLLKRKK